MAGLFVLFPGLCSGQWGGEDIRIPFAWHGEIEGADDPIVGKFRDGRQILASAAGMPRGNSLIH